MEDLEIGQVFHSEQPALLLGETSHLLSDGAAIEVISGGLNCGFPAQRGVTLLHFYEAAEGASQVLLHQKLARL